MPTLRRMPRAALVAGASLLLWTLPPPASLADAAAPAWQSAESVRAAAERFALELMGSAPGVTVEAVGVDTRLRLPACGRPLSVSSAGAFASGHGTVAVGCPGARPWRVFVPVRTTRSVPVVVTGRPLERGARLTSDDLRLAEQPSAGLPYQYFARLDDLVGMTLRRALPAGTVLVPAAVERATLVARGARVSLVARTAAVVVKAEGTALDAAALGQRVRVKTAVGRVVEGVVAGEGLVQVGGAAP